MLRILYIVFIALALLFAVYGLITKNTEFNFIVLFLLGLSMLIKGLQEFQKKRKVFGLMLTVIFLLFSYISIKDFYYRYLFEI